LNSLADGWCLSASLAENPTLLRLGNGLATMSAKANMKPVKGVLKRQGKQRSKQERRDNDVMNVSDISAIDATLRSINTRLIPATDKRQ
jgi:hypothetical protein